VTLCDTWVPRPWVTQATLVPTGLRYVIRAEDSSHPVPPPLDACVLIVLSRERLRSAAFEGLRGQLPCPPLLFWPFVCILQRAGWLSGACVGCVAQLLVAHGSSNDACVL
jgi:hypothetical protein